MENPDAYRAGKDLIEFTCQRNHMNSCKCFSLKFYQENDMPLLTGRFLSRENGETRESGTDAFSNPGKRDGCVFQPGSLAAYMGTVV